MNPKILLVCVLLVFTVLPSSFIPLAKATTSPGKRPYYGQCYLSYSPTTKINVQPPLVSITAITAKSGGAGCNGVGYVSTGAATSGFGSSSATVAVTFQDQWFTVPNLGQSYTHMSLSGDYLVLGYLEDDGVVGACCWISSGTSLSVTIYLYQEPIGGGTPSIQTYWTLHSSADWGAPCSQKIAGSCGSFLTLSGLQSFNVGYDLSPGYQYAINMTFVSQSNVNSAGLGYVNTMSCGDYSVASWCQSVPSDVNGGVLPQAPSSTCPTGTSGTPCFYLQWQDSTVNLTDSATGPPDFSMSLSSSSNLALDGEPRLLTTVTLQPLNGFSGSVTLYYIIYPPRGSIALPVVYFVNWPGGNGTTIVNLAGGTASGYLAFDPCSSTDSTGYCSGRGALITPGFYTIVVMGVSGGIGHQTPWSVNVQFYDFSVQKVTSSYSTGILTVTANMENIGNKSPGNYSPTQQAGWAEMASYYLDDILVSQVYVCEWGGDGYCMPGVSYSPTWQTSTTFGPHNVTVTATEAEFNKTTGKTVLGQYFDINPNNQRYYSDFGLFANPGSMSVTSSSTVTSIIKVQALPDFFGTVSVSGSASSGWGLAFNTTSVSLNSGQNKNVTATISVPSSTSPGTYTVTVTGTSTTPSITHALKIVINVPDFSLCCSNSFSLVTGQMLSTGVNIQSLTGFAGTVTLKLSTTMVGDTTISLSPTNVTLSSGQLSSSALGITSGSQTGAWSFTVTGQSGNLVHSLNYTVTISACCTGGGGGSVADGTLITLADGSKVPVQNLKVGDKMLGYDTATGTYTVSIVNSFTVVDTTNMLIIHTSAGTPFRVDANPRQTLWVKTVAGIVGWVPVTQIKSGDDLWTQNGWVKVTSIEFAPAGQHVMYDIFASAPYFADGYLDPIHKM